MIRNLQEKGTVIIITFLILVILLLLGSYFLTFALTESRISKSQQAGARTYYLAEAGINEAIWKLKNNDTWKTNFETDPDWSPADFSRDFGSGSYTVTVRNLECGRAKINATSTLPVSSGKFAQRAVKAEVFRAPGSITEDSAVFTGGACEDIDIIDSQITINDGNFYCGKDLNIKGESIVKVYDNLETEDPNPDDGIIENLEGQVLVGKNLDGQDKITAFEAICAKNVCDEKCEGYPPLDTGCPPEDIGELPKVDFYSDYPECNSSDSFKCRAKTAENDGDCHILCNNAPCAHPSDKCIYSRQEFDALLSEVGDEGTLTLNPDKLRNIIFYVTGCIRLKGNRNLIVYGTLVTDDNIYIGKKGEESSHVTINQPDTSPSGLLSQGKITFSYADFDITGVIYALNPITIENVQVISNVKGGIMARKMNFEDIGQLNITLDNDIIEYGLGYKIDGLWVGQPEFSPTIIIDHWEESY